MFYLGGLTLGYLTPHVPAPDAQKPTGFFFRNKRTETVQDKAIVQPAPRDEDEPPILWPWHIFY